PEAVTHSAIADRRAGPARQRRAKRPDGLPRVVGQQRIAHRKIGPEIGRMLCLYPAQERNGVPTLNPEPFGKRQQERDWGVRHWRVVRQFRQYLSILPCSRIENTLVPITWYRFRLSRYLQQPTPLRPVGGTN